MLALLDFLDTPLRIAFVALGIGFIIFIHELGHFLAARMCGVRCETFSLGFGPPLFSFRRGDTDYQIALLPIGGFVKMAGDDPSQATGRPDDLLSKSVEKRFFIYSAGVIMNAILAFVLFPILFLVGMPFDVPVIGQRGPTPGGPAWRAGLRAGDEIEQVGERKIYDWLQIRTEVALGDPEAKEFVVRRDGAEQTFRVTPEYNEGLGIHLAGLGTPPYESLRPRLDIPPGGEAEKAGLKTGDLLLAVDGIELEDIDGYSAIFERSRFRPRSTATFVVERGGERFETAVPLVPAEPPRRLLGIQSPTDVVDSTRAVGRAATDPAARAFLAEGGLPAGARLLSVAGVRIGRSEDLRSALRGAAEDASVRFVWRADGASEDASFELALPAEERAAFLADVADGIALRADESRARLLVQAGSPAAASGLQDFDEVVALGEVQDLSAWAKEHGEKAWDGVQELVQEHVEKAGEREQPLRVTVVRAGSEGPERLSFEVTPQAVLSFPLAFEWRTRTHLVHGDGLLGAFGFGVQRSLDMFRDVYLSLKGMVSGRVSAEKNLGGIVAISQLSFQLSENLMRFFFFLGMLSVNLAVLNLLPIPVLDGGHLFFLLIEKVKGSPVNDRVMGYSQMVGLLLVLFLLIFVTFNDLRRLFA